MRMRMMMMMMITLRKASFCSWCLLISWAIRVARSWSALACLVTWSRLVVVEKILQLLWPWRPGWGKHWWQDTLKANHLPVCTHAQDCPAPSTPSKHRLGQNQTENCDDDHTDVIAYNGDEEVHYEGFWTKLWWQQWECGDLLSSFVEVETCRHQLMSLLSPDQGHSKNCFHTNCNYNNHHQQLLSHFMMMLVITAPCDQVLPPVGHTVSNLFHPRWIKMVRLQKNQNKIMTRIMWNVIHT